MNRTDLASDLSAALWGDLIPHWFPACVDPAGGFFQRFQSDWTLCDDGLRGAVFQSRMTWLCATLAETAHTRADEFRAYALHGLEFLTGRIVDPQTGGVYWVVDPSGKPIGDYADQRHSYGASFALYALAAVYRATKDPRALASAQQIFDWLERCAHDDVNGGYFECADLVGEPLLTPPPGWTGPNRDAIGTYYGQKSQNTHLHLLEAFTELATVWPDSRLIARLRETWGILTARLFDAAGWLHQFAQLDWTPVPGLVSYGHDIEAAHLLMSAAQVLEGEVGARTREVARALIDYVLRHGLDRELGGLYNTGTSEGEVSDETKIWWVQAEALLGLVRGFELPGIDSRLYQEALTGTWSWIKNFQIDPVHGGWHGYLSREGKPLHFDAKGDMWKAAYHDGRALLFASRALASSVGPSDAEPPTAWPV